MQTAERYDAWTAGQSYDQYMGRWSGMIARRFLDWLDAPDAADWLEVGCGTGALTAAILGRCSPCSVLATDPSRDFLAHAQDVVTDARVLFRTAFADDLPADDGTVDVVTSGLVLNFLPDHAAGLLEMRRVLRPGGLLSFYVWNYPAGGMGFIDAFWKAAASLEPEVARLDEGLRFPFCTSEGLTRLCAEAGVVELEVAPIEIVTEFPDFDAFWLPFTLGAGPAPGYCMSLPEDRRIALKLRLKERLGPDAPVCLNAQAWAVKARRPD